MRLTKHKIKFWILKRIPHFVMWGLIYMIWKVSLICVLLSTNPFQFLYPYLNFSKLTMCFFLVVFPGVIGAGWFLKNEGDDILIAYQDYIAELAFKSEDKNKIKSLLGLNPVRKKTWERSMTGSYLVDFVSASMVIGILLISFSNFSIGIGNNPVVVTSGVSNYAVYDKVTRKKFKSITCNDNIAVCLKKLDEEPLYYFDNIEIIDNKSTH
jgi:hypothetical protein